MPFSAGTFSRLYSWVNDRSQLIKISAEKMDAEFNGIATGLSTCLLRDGTSVPSTSMSWGGQRLTSLGDASAATDALNRRAADDRYWTPTPYAQGTVTTGTVSFDLTNGPLQTITVAGNQIWQVTNKPSTDMWMLWIVCTNGGGFTISYPTIAWYLGDGTTSNLFEDTGVDLATSGVNHILVWGFGSGTVYGRAM